ncbi:hypothetical protein MMC21_006570 [Puttea exsequens]|nr:hypothetical protein [Puttea exsequens]
MPNPRYPHQRELTRKEVLRVIHLSQSNVKITSGPCTNQRVLQAMETLPANHLKVHNKAARKDGLTDVLDTLLSDSDTNLEETDDRGRTPLILAADLGKADMVNRFVESQSIEINATDELGRTALHYCTQTKMMNQTTEKLLDHGADVNVQDDGSYPPMYYAIKDDNYDAVKMLLDHHATTDFEFPEKPIPRSINGLIEKYNTTGSTDSVSEFQRARTNDSDDLKRK